MSPGGEGFAVETGGLRAQARAVDDVRARFAAVKGASAYIRQDDQAYGLLCGWISGILEDRHRRQDELFAYVEENLLLVAGALYETAAEYDAAESGAADPMTSLGRRVGAGPWTAG